MNFPQYLEKKYLEWQQVVGERKTVREFAELQTATTRQTTARQTLKTLAETVHILPSYIQTAEPTRVNATLHQFIQAIHLTKTHTLTIEYK